MTAIVQGLSSTLSSRPFASDGITLKVELFGGVSQIQLLASVMKSSGIRLIKPR